jgi:molybdopterin-guanine dinucleotide biosynthesis protein A
VTGIAGILLTGGHSRRLGVDKATLLLGGEPLARRSARQLESVCTRAVEVGDGVSGLPAVREEHPGSGPLAAVAAGGEWLAEHGYSGAAIVLAVDLPNVTERLLQLLRDYPGADTAIPRVEGQLQLVCARYGSEALLAAASLIAGGIRSLHGLVDVIDYDVIEPDVWSTVASADAFLDIDTPEDARRSGITIAHDRDPRLAK